MRGLVHAGTSLLCTHSQFSYLVNSLRSLAKDRILFFSLSLDAPELEQSVKQLSSITVNSIGCLSGPLPIKAHKPFFSCSAAIFEKDDCVSFSSLVTGEDPVQVGRWHSYNKKKIPNKFDGFDGRDIDGNVNWKEIWAPKSPLRFLPSELEAVRDIETVIYFSDKSALDLAMAVHEHLPQAHQLGITAWPTPFVTGQPFTLLRDGKVQTSGAVGLALRTRSSETSLDFEGLIRLTEPLPIRKAEGNLIHELGDSFPARILMKAIQELGLPDELSKDVEYYIGVHDSSERDKTLPKLHRVIAGSPSRGSIAVEEVPAPPSGTLIEFYYRKMSTSASIPAGVLQSSTHISHGLIAAFVEAPENSQPSLHQSHQHVDDTGGLTFPTYKHFLSSTENGFAMKSDILGQSFVPWKCTVPGAFGGLGFRLGKKISSTCV